jgi:3-oxoacyl-[acyl-carrier-protein] synthase-3
MGSTYFDNSFFTELDIHSDSQWIADRTGIQARYSVLDHTDIHLLRQGTTDYIRLMHAGRGMSIAAMASQAWTVMRERWSRTGGQSDIEALISGTSVPDWDIPANACVIARALGFNCTAFDVNSACSSFVVGVHVLRSLLLSGAGRCGAVFTCERYSLRLNYAECNNCVLFGDGAAGAVFEVAPGNPRGLELLDTMVASDPSGAHLVIIPVGGMFAQHGRAVQKFAITKTVEITEALLQCNGLLARDIRYFISHQANLRMLTSVVSRLGLHREQHLYNVDSHGNQGAAGAPMVMSMHWERFAPGDLIVMAVVGAGLTWGAALFRCL